MRLPRHLISAVLGLSVIAVGGGAAAAAWFSRTLPWRCFFIVVGILGVWAIAPQLYLTKVVVFALAAHSIVCLFRAASSPDVGEAKAKLDVVRSWIGRAIVLSLATPILLHVAIGCGDQYFGKLFQTLATSPSYRGS